MLARALRITLAIEFAVLVALGIAIASGADGGVSAAAWIVGIGVGWRLLLVLHSFVLSRLHGTHRGSRGLALARLVAIEWCVIAFGYGILQAFPGRLGPRPGTGRGPRVMLVHGYLCNRAIWTWFARRLDERGYRVDVPTIEPVLGDIDRQADALAGRIESLGLAPGERITLVGHSMGGLVARAYLRRFAARGRIAKLITCGTPHQGTALAVTAIGMDGRQMKRSSAWLAELASAAPAAIAALPEGCVTIASHDDNLVAPQDSALLPGARAVELAGVSHTAMPFSRAVFDAVLAELPPARAGVGLEVDASHQVG